jgi:hypothetical protein
MRTVLRIGTAGALVVCVLGIGQGTGAADQGCTGTTASTAARLPGPFGALVVAPTAQDVEGNFGQVVIRPEATAPHGDCP